MGRHGYTDDCDDYLAQGRWRGMVKSALRGKRGQRLLRDLIAALDAMPEKRLITGLLANADGEACALGAACLYRKAMTMEEMVSLLTDGEDDDPDWTNEHLSDRLDVAKCLIQEVEYENDEGGYSETPEKRWVRMRAWAEKRIIGADK